ncbi:MAG TPA: 16S rRNA (guanine(966)-N(2))-methyltransferase RsmD [Gammaproteobacteria bacterium]
MAARHGAGRNQLRIIGGSWRSRRLAFPEVEGLRPTPDRVRETLFNWLMPVIHGARCLDLFTGSGALGLEALSRGAASVVLLDRDARVIATLRCHLQTLKAEGATLLQQNALDYLQGEATPFDIVFLDPPFRQGLLQPALQLLHDRGWLAPGARLYIEQESEQPQVALPEGWELLRELKAGQVACRLVQAAG